MAREHPFRPTECACPGCQACCKHMPGNLVPGDFEAMQRGLGIPTPVLEQMLLASPGALVRGPRGEFRIPTIVPDRDATGRCVFHDDQTGRCRIHKHAPFGCRYFDVHMSGAKGDKRSKYGLRLIQADPMYAQRHRRLTRQGRVAPDPGVLRKRLAEGLKTDGE